MTHETNQALKDEPAAESARPPGPQASSRVPAWVSIAAIAALLLSVVTYYLRLDKVVGLMGDDSWYVLLAKAIATGQGYTLVNSPTPGILPLYPPGFPFLLSFVFRVAPSFPENVWLLKSVSIVAMLAVGVMAYRYFLYVRNVPAGIALGIATVTVLCPPLVFLATSSVMSDCVFMFFFFATVVAVEQCARAKGTGRREWLWALLAGALCSYTFLTRSIAISVIAAAALYLLKERMVRAAAIVCLVAAAVAGPWIIHTRLHTPTAAQQLEQGGNIVLPYTYQFWQRLAGDSESGTVTARDLPKRVWFNLLEISGRDVARVLVTLIFETRLDPRQELIDFFRMRSEQVYQTHKQTLWFSHLLTIIAVIGLIKVIRQKLTFAELAVPSLLAVILLWPFETVRYVLPMTPFVVFYLLQGLRALQQFAQDKFAPRLRVSHWALPAAALVFILLLQLLGNLGQQFSAGGSSVQSSAWVSQYEEIENTVRWLDRAVPKSETIIATNPALVHLLTERKTVGWDNPTARWEMWKKLPARYVAWLALGSQPPGANEAPFRMMYVSRDGSYFRVLDLGPSEGRPGWATSPAAVP